MDRKQKRDFEGLRRTSGAVENQLFDDFANGEMDRKTFLQRGTLFGLSLSALGTALVGLGEAPVAHARRATAGASAARRLQAAILPLPSFIEPHKAADGGTAATFGGEFLTRATQNLRMAPELAIRWTPNADASQWTFTLRPNVVFQNGPHLSPEDVIATYRRLTDPASGSQALSAFNGVLNPDGIRKLSSNTVAFNLEAPNASFPYLVSSATYQAIILPSAYQVGSFASLAQVTGAFQITSYTPGVGASYAPYGGWWGGKIPLPGIDARFYSDTAALDAALLSGAVDIVNPNVVSLGTDRALFNSSNLQVFSAPSSAHTQICMRTDMPPFNDVRVRQAVALSLDRNAIVNLLYGKYGRVGNDHPLAPVYPASVPIPQRAKDLRRAKALMAAAGHPRGFDITMTVGLSGANPTLAQIVAHAVKAIGIRMTLKVEPTSLYYAGTATTTHWLNDPMTMTLWGHRPIPDVIMSASLSSTGVWNAAHYKSAKYDSLLQSFIGAVALADKRKYAVQLEKLVQRDTPIIFPAFSDALTVGTKKLVGYHVAPTGLHISKVSLAD